MKAVALVPLAFLFALTPALAIAATPKPAIKIENPGECIAPTAKMRTDHKSMLSHARDRTLRQGIRGEKASLNGCIECHASKTTGSVLGKEGFCQTCHDYAAVKVDCWQCHQPKVSRAGVKP